jgi:methanol metabolism-related c-type cytochrome
VKQCILRSRGPINRSLSLLAIFAGLQLLLLIAPVEAAAPNVPAGSKAVKDEGGKYLDAKGDPTYNIGPDGKVDWYTFSGFLRYNGTCDVCHGPDGSGSSFGPDLTHSLKSISYSEFKAIVSGGKQNVTTSEQLVMPAFGNDKNVMCYLDDICVYLRARSDGVLPRGRPASHEDKPPEAKSFEDSCMGP